ncbi:hypothetical protein SCA31_04190 [Chryseobacterium sp. SIMBA_028]
MAGRYTLAAFLPVDDEKFSKKIILDSNSQDILQYNFDTKTKKIKALLFQTLTV